MAGNESSHTVRLEDLCKALNVDYVCVCAHTVPYLVSSMGFFFPAFLHRVRVAVLCASMSMLRICNIAQNQWIIYSNKIKNCNSF